MTCLLGDLSGTGGGPPCCVGGGGGAVGGGGRGPGSERCQKSSGGRVDRIGGTGAGRGHSPNSVGNPLSFREPSAATWTMPACCLGASEDECTATGSFPLSLFLRKTTFFRDKIGLRDSLLCKEVAVGEEAALPTPFAVSLFPDCSLFAASRAWISTRENCTGGGANISNRAALRFGRG